MAKKDDNLSIRISKEHKDMLEGIAEFYGVSLSQLSESILVGFAVSWTQGRKDSEK